MYHCSKMRRHSQAQESETVSEDREIPDEKCPVSLSHNILSTEKLLEGDLEDLDENSESLFRQIPLENNQQKSMDIAMNFQRSLSSLFTEN